MELLELFGHNLKRCRRRADITQAELARLIGISESAVHNIEAGTLFVSDEILERITAVLCILPEELFYSGEETTREAIHADIVKKVLETHFKHAERIITDGVEV